MAERLLPFLICCKTIPSNTNYQLQLPEQRPKAVSSRGFDFYLSRPSTTLRFARGTEIVSRFARVAEFVNQGIITDFDANHSLRKVTFSQKL